MAQNLKDFKYFDTHAHVNFSFYQEEVSDVLERASKAGVVILNIGTDLKDSKENIKLAEKNDFVLAATGVHPTSLGINGLDREDLRRLEEMATNPEVRAIGECGLDYFREENKTNKNKRVQKESFLWQIGLAEKVKKPLILHLRTEEAIEEAIEIIKKEAGEKIPAIVWHFFSGTEEQTRKILMAERNYFSFGGVVTFTRDYDKIIRMIPAERIMAETDSPFVAPVPYRGQTNEPSYVGEVVKKIREIKELDDEEIAKIAIKTAIKVFGLNKNK